MNIRVCVCVCESLCFTCEINTMFKPIVLQYFFLIKHFKKVFTAPNVSMGWFLVL